jgi:hypothetical protein
MFRTLLLTLMLLAPAKSYAWDLTSSLGDIATPQNGLFSVGDPFSNGLPLREHGGNSAWLPQTPSRFHDLDGMIIRGQDEGESGGGDSNDPTAPIMQLRFQNLFGPESFDSSGYSNQFILQPVIPLMINDDGYFKYRIFRPTIPVIAPSADPDGPRGSQGGLGNTSVIDLLMHPMPEIKSTLGLGSTYIVPTATHSQLGLREWAFGPSIVFTTTAIDKWLIGGLYYQPFSMQSNAYQVLFQPLVIRNLPNQWYVGLGDVSWKFDDHKGQYDIPIALRIGKVAKIGRHSWNIFLQPSYTPPGLHKGDEGGIFLGGRDAGGGGGGSWSIKLNFTLLIPGKKLYDPILHPLSAH